MVIRRRPLTRHDSRGEGPTTLAFGFCRASHPLEGSKPLPRAETPSTRSLTPLTTSSCVGRSQSNLWTEGRSPHASEPSELGKTGCRTKPRNRGCIQARVPFLRTLDSAADSEESARESSTNPKIGRRRAPRLCCAHSPKLVAAASKPRTDRARPSLAPHPSAAAEAALVGQFARLEQAAARTALSRLARMLCLSRSLGAAPRQARRGGCCDQLDQYLNPLSPHRFATRRSLCDATRSKSRKRLP